MNKQSKAEAVSDIKGKIVRSKAIFITGYKGLKVGELTNLRRDLRKSNGDLKIVKNTIFLLSARDTVPGIREETFTGSTAVMFAYDDPSVVARQVVGFSKSNPLLVIKAGIIDNNFVAADKVILFSTLPDRNALIVMLLNVLNTPMSRLAYAAASPLSGLITVLNGIIQNKQTKN
ncbi:MAG: 50S ribosomal protein L10 [Deltaproteobacteria bacterium]|nr:50S ribosomal protein L10 [Deltaproteobacteria bacterium]MCL5276524.1 50S ribosomal protein L10 [Deltaproteobacteria bacterium]